MIENEQQYRITQEQLTRFQRTLAQFDSGDIPVSTDPRLRQAQRDAIESVIDDLLEQIAIYEGRTTHGTRPTPE